MSINLKGGQPAELVALQEVKKELQEVKGELQKTREGTRFARPISIIALIVAIASFLFNFII